MQEEWYSELPPDSDEPLPVFRDEKAGPLASSLLDSGGKTRSQRRKASSQARAAVGTFPCSMFTRCLLRSFPPSLPSPFSCPTLCSQQLSQVRAAAARLAAVTASSPPSHSHDSRNLPLSLGIPPLSPPPPSKHPTNHGASSPTSYTEAFLRRQGLPTPPRPPAHIPDAGLSNAAALGYPPSPTATSRELAALKDERQFLRERLQSTEDKLHASERCANSIHASCFRRVQPPGARRRVFLTPFPVPHVPGEFESFIDC